MRVAVGDADAPAARPSRCVWLRPWVSLLTPSGKHFLNVWGALRMAESGTKEHFLSCWASSLSLAPVSQGTHTSSDPAHPSAGGASQGTKPIGTDSVSMASPRR